MTTHSEEELGAARQPAKPGPLVRRGGWFNHVRLGFNYRLDRSAGRARDRAAGEARRDARAALRRGRAVRGAPRGRRRASSSHRRTTRTTRARGSSTSSRSRRESTATHVIDRLAARGVEAWPRTCPQSTSSRTCASATASREGLCPVAEDAARAPSRSRSSRRSRPPTRSWWSRRSGTRRRVGG